MQAVWQIYKFLLKNTENSVDFLAGHWQITSCQRKHHKLKVALIYRVPIWFPGDIHKISMYCKSNIYFAYMWARQQAEPSSGIPASPKAVYLAEPCSGEDWIEVVKDVIRLMVQKSGEKTSWGWYSIPLFPWFYTSQVVSRIPSINSITTLFGPIIAISHVSFWKGNETPYFREIVGEIYCIIGWPDIICNQKHFEELNSCHHGKLIAIH